MAAKEAPRALLTRGEVAMLLDVSLSVVDKAIEQRSVPTRRRRNQTLLDSDGLALIAIFERARMPLPVKIKQRVRDWVVREKPYRKSRPSSLSVSETIVVRCGDEVRERTRAADKYARLRDRYIEINPSRLGGAPVIRGTRISVHGLAERITDGDTIDLLLEDYPYVPREAFEVALVYAKANPRRGRPIKPWRQNSAARA